MKPARRSRLRSLMYENQANRSDLGEWVNSPSCMSPRSDFFCSFLSTGLNAMTRVVGPLPNVTQTQLRCSTGATASAKAGLFSVCRAVSRHHEVTDTCSAERADVNERLENAEGVPGVSKFELMGRKPLARRAFPTSPRGPHD